MSDRLNTAVHLTFIKRRRVELSITQQEMAESMGFKNASTYLKYERGVYAFRAEHIPILMAKLKCGMNDLFM